MIRLLLLVCVANLAATQYAPSRYGSDGIRNRYFILGHGRGPIDTSLGSGIYGASSRGHESPRATYGSDTRHRSYNEPSRRYSSHHSRHSPSYAAPVPAYAPAPASYAPSYSAPQSSYGPSYASSRSHSAPSYGPASGYSAPAYSSYRKHDDYAQPTPYEFGYDVESEHGDKQSRSESGDGYGNVRGSYGYRDSYGVYRNVDYIADDGGFRANVRTNEPGTAPQDPAHVKMQVEHEGDGY